MGENGAFLERALAGINALNRLPWLGLEHYGDSGHDSFVFGLAQHGLCVKIYRPERTDDELRTYFDLTHKAALALERFPDLSFGVGHERYALRARVVPIIGSGHAGSAVWSVSRLIHPAAHVSDADWPVGADRGQEQVTDALHVALYRRWGVLHRWQQFLREELGLDGVLLRNPNMRYRLAEKSATVYITDITTQIPLLSWLTPRKPELIRAP